MFRQLAFISAATCLASSGLLVPSLASTGATESISVGSTSYVSMVENLDVQSKADPSQLYHVSDGDSMTATTTGPDEIQIEAGPSYGDLQVGLLAPAGQSLTTGTQSVPDGTVAQDQNPGGVSCTADDIGGGFGSGAYDILDIGFGADGQIDRLLATYTCGGDYGQGGPSYGADFGVISLNEPASTDPLVATPQSVHWPTTYLGEAEASVPVQIANNTDVPATLNAAQVSGENADDFTITDDECGGAILAAGQTCEVDIAFAPSGADARTATLTVPAAGSTGPIHVPLSGSGFEGLTELVGQQDRGPGQAASHMDVTPADQKMVAFSGNGFELNTYDLPAQNFWTLILSPADHELFTAGDTYTNHPDGSSQYVLGGAVPLTNSCDDAVETLHVISVEYNSLDQIEEFSATWLQTCFDQAPAARGAVAYRSPDPLPALPAWPTYTPGFVLRPTSLGSATGAAVAWTNPPSPDWTYTVVRRSVGSTTPSSPTDGTAVYSGTGTAATSHHLTAAAGYTFSMFSVAANGDFGPAETEHVATCRLRLWAPTYDSATHVTVTGRLTTASGKPLVDQYVILGRIGANQPGAPTYRIQYPTNKSGIVHFTFRVDGSVRVLLAYRGGIALAGRTTAIKTINVED